MGDTTFDFGSSDGFYNDPGAGNAYSFGNGFDQPPVDNAFAAPPPNVIQPQVPSTNNNTFEGSMAPPSGSMDAGTFGNNASFDGVDEPPLLEELGINFAHIQAKTLSVLNPMSNTDANILAETDLAGALVFGFLFGATLLATGRVQFGYIYGVATVGCLSLYTILNLMSERDMTLGLTASVLGYCLLPMVLLSAIGIVLSLKGTLGAILSLTCVFWCALAASKMFASGLHMHDQRLLVGYPCFLLYGVFAIITIF
eukprot:m.186437 g.186437  ORF g.186437 m.186437 type:complete len:255 (+) comp15591_c0_seq4:1480-2244(+)